MQSLINDILAPFKRHCSPHDRDVGCESGRLMKSLATIVIIFLIIFLVNKYLWEKKKYKKILLLYLKN